MTPDTISTTKQKRPSGTKKKKISESKLRGWAKRIQARVDALETLDPPKIGETIPRERHPALSPDQHQELHDWRAKVWYVQHWTYSSTDEEGRHLLFSLETGKVEAAKVWLALNAVSQHTEAGALPPYAEWIASLLEEEG